ncbi:tRNA (N6-isopentenyl adenosine(37)-C2)-methylthiotransferase MiaB [Candidatus Uhrbacteria bacterium]|nr:tRNA (N6-isopentenyl adenosine(37)-C2)-methylthiotransferase MiaB [Candidatus Uhrbacteria bacterium]
MKYLITTFGCQMNKNDSERLGAILTSLGFSWTEDENEADIIITNTCSVRQSAEERIYGKQMDWIKLKEKKPELIVAVTGCMAGRDKDGAIRRKLPHVDLFFPTRDMVNLPRWIAELRPQWGSSGDIVQDYLKIKPLHADSAQAYVTIQTGCNQFCTYCVVPHARGLEVNRPLADILEEIRGLAKDGVIEVTLLGQAVNAYHAPDPENFSAENPYSDHFAKLLWEANRIDSLKRLFWTAPHPNFMSDDVIDALTLPKQLNYLHLPVQAGNDEVLKRMNRKYTREKFLDIMKKIKAKCPDMALGTDIIVGFSGETDEQFEDTLSLYRECGFDISYTAQYSQRTGTLGAKLYADDVSAEEKRRRWDVLQKLMEETALRKNQVFVDNVVNVLVERIEEGKAWGNSREMKLTCFPATDMALVGKEVPVKITKAMTWQLQGELV